MSKKWTRRSALALIGSGAGLLTWGTGGFTDVTADREVNIDTTADDSPTDDPLLGITIHDDQVVFETETRELVTLTNNTGEQLDTVGATIQNPVQLDFNVKIDSFPDSLDSDESGTVTATITGSGSNRIKETGQIELEITASSTATDSAPEITASRSVSLSCVNCINFETPDTVTPSGFIPGTGSEFGLRDEFDSKSTLHYGWESEQTDTTRERGERQDIEEDTLAHFTTDDRIPTTYDASKDPYWKIDLPDGWYDVTMNCRDPSYSDQEYSFDVAGGAELVELRDTNFDDENNRRSTDGKTYSFPVEVAGANLSITPPDGTYNPKINWLRFESRDKPEPEPVDISAEGSSDKRGYNNQDYYFSITNTHDSPIEFTGVRVDFARTVDDGTYIEPDLLGRADGKYEVEISVGEKLEFNNGKRAKNADYRDNNSDGSWGESEDEAYLIGDKIPLTTTSGKYQLDSEEEAELGLFAFREYTFDGTELLDMEGADVHITLWYKDDNGKTYSTTSAVLGDSP